MTSHRSGRWLLCGALLSLGLSSASASAKVTRVDSQQYRGSIDRQGKVVRLKWTTLVGASPQTVVAKLSAWKDAERVVSGTTKIVATQTSVTSAKLHVDLETPFFLPDVNVDVRATVSPPTADGQRVVWERVGGTAKVFRRVWDVTAAPGGARVTHEMELEMPFDVPALFASGRLKKQITDDVDKLQALVGPGRAPADGP